MGGPRVGGPRVGGPRVGGPRGGNFLGVGPWGFEEIIGCLFFLLFKLFIPEKHRGVGRLPI